MVFNVCVKFNENMSSRFKVMVWTRKLLTHNGEQLQNKENQSYSSCVLQAVSWRLTFVRSFMKIYQAVLKLCSGYKNC